MTSSKRKGEENESATSIEEDLDSLFRLPLKEFTAARNALATRLKKAGNLRGSEQVKALAKPPVSAWAVNQLYWRHGDAFKELTASGERLASAQASQLAGRVGDMRGLLTARRETLSNLAHLAEELLKIAGHNPTPDIMRRITATLEALSTYSSLPDAPRPGRLTADVDAPGFASLAALIPAGEAPKPKGESPPITPSKAALEAAEQAVRDTRARAQEAAAILKKASARANETESERRLAEERLKTASLAAEQALQRLHSATTESEEASRKLEQAERAVQRARKEYGDLGTDS